MPINQDVCEVCNRTGLEILQRGHGSHDQQQLDKNFVFKDCKIEPSEAEPRGVVYGGKVPVIEVGPVLRMRAASIKTHMPSEDLLVNAYTSEDGKIHHLRLSHVDRRGDTEEWVELRRDQAMALIGFLQEVAGRTVEPTITERTQGR